MGLSQTDLAVSIGLTFQQVQKYERGSNRISASKLYDIAHTLKVPVDYFFQGYGGTEVDSEATEADAQQIAQNLLMTPEGIELATAFPRIRSSRQRQKVLDLVRSLGNGDAETDDAH